MFEHTYENNTEQFLKKLKLCVIDKLLFLEHYLSLYFPSFKRNIYDSKRICMASMVLFSVPHSTSTHTDLLIIHAEPLDQKTIEKRNKPALVFMIK